MSYNIAKHSAQGNRARTQKLSPIQRSMIARKAAMERWLKYGQERCECGAYRSAHKPPMINHKFVKGKNE